MRLLRLFQGRDKRALEDFSSLNILPAHSQSFANAGNRDVAVFGDCPLCGMLMRAPNYPDCVNNTLELSLVLSHVN